MTGTERFFPINEETGLPCIACDDMTLFRFILRRDGSPPDDVEITDPDGNIDAGATAKAREALAALSRILANCGRD